MQVFCAVAGFVGSAQRRTHAHAGTHITQPRRAVRHATWSVQPVPVYLYAQVGVDAVKERCSQPMVGSAEEESRAIAGRRRHRTRLNVSRDVVEMVQLQAVSARSQPDIVIAR